MLNPRDRVPPEVREARFTICGNCPKLAAGVCRECGCVARLKVKVASQSCPLGKWSTHDPA